MGGPTQYIFYSIFLVSWAFRIEHKKYCIVFFSWNLILFHRKTMPWQFHILKMCPLCTFQSRLFCSLIYFYSCYHYYLTSCPNHFMFNLYVSGLYYLIFIWIHFFRSTRKCLSDLVCSWCYAKRQCYVVKSIPVPEDSKELPSYTDWDCYWLAVFLYTN